MSDYRLKISIKNNILLSKIKEAGYDSVCKFCKTNKIPYPPLLNIISLHLSPMVYRRNGSPTFRKCVLYAADALKCLPEDLFTEKQLFMELDKNKTEILIKESEVEYIINAPHNLCVSPEDQALGEDISLGIKKALETLTPREQKLIEMRFTEDLTLNECSITFDVTIERVRQIEAKALRKLRHPSRKAMIIADGESR